MEMWCTPILLFISVCVISLYCRIRSAYKFWQSKGVPFMKPSFFCGNIKDAILQKKFVSAIIKEAYYKFENERFFGFYSFQTPIWIPKDPELIKTILTKDFAYFHDRDEIFNIDCNPLFESLPFIGGKKWKILRNKIMPAFSSVKLKSMFSLIAEISESFVENMKKTIPNNNEIKIKEFITDYSINTITSCAFGLSTDTIDNMREDIKEFVEFISRPKISHFIGILSMEFLPNLARLLRLKILSRKQENFFFTIFKTTIEQRKKEGIYRPDFLQILIELKKFGNITENEVIDIQNLQNVPRSTEVDFEFTDKILAAQAFAFLAAGFETSSGTLNYCLYSLALNTDIQDQLREEVKTILKNNGSLTYEAIMEMKYLQMVLSETLRLYPLSPFLLRVTSMPYKIPGTNITLPKDMKVRIPTFAIHRDPKIYPDPLKFIPERFKEENKINNYTYLPFGEGPRYCAGMRFAKLQMSAILAKLICSYKFEVCPKTCIPMKFHNFSYFTLVPETEIWLKVIKLSD